MDKKVNYEHVFIARQDLAPSSVESLVTKFTDILKSEKASVSKIEYCGLRPLAYPIKKNRKGHYILMNITSAPAAVAELERNMRISEDVLRFFTTTTKELESGPSNLLKQSRNYIDPFANSSKVFSNKDLANELSADDAQDHQ